MYTYTHIYTLMYNTHTHTHRQDQRISEQTQELEALWESLLILSGRDPEGRWMEVLLGVDEAGMVEAWGWGADEPGREGEGGPG